MVARGADGTDQILWGKNLQRCSKNPYSLIDPYDSYQHNKWNRDKLRKVKVGTVVRCMRGDTGWEALKVLRILRSGCHQHVKYSVALDRCIHHQSVRLSKKMLSRARRDNKLWGCGCQPAAIRTERHVVSPETYVSVTKPSHPSMPNPTYTYTANITKVHASSRLDLQDRFPGAIEGHGAVNPARALFCCTGGGERNVQEVQGKRSRGKLRGGQ